MDKVGYFEIPVDNLERAKNFYKKAFDWGINPVPQMEYTTLTTSAVDENNMIKEPGAINGGMMQRRDPLKTPVLTIIVENIEEAFKKIENLGGKIIVPKMELPNMGFYAYFMDTEGNILGLFQGIMQPEKK